MSEKKSFLQSIQLKESKRLKDLLIELGLNNRYHAVLVDGKKVVDLETMIQEDSKIIILPKLQGG
ncbi:MAG: MoaD/ThiS family protein [Candidatus Helarchaeota archaeon]